MIWKHAPPLGVDGINQGHFFWWEPMCSSASKPKRESERLPNWVVVHFTLGPYVPVIFSQFSLLIHKRNENGWEFIWEEVQTSLYRLVEFNLVKAFFNNKFSYNFIPHDEPVPTCKGIEPSTRESHFRAQKLWIPIKHINLQKCCQPNLENQQLKKGGKQDSQLVNCFLFL